VLSGELAKDALGYNLAALVLGSDVRMNVLAEVFNRRVWALEDRAFKCAAEHRAKLDINLRSGWHWSGLLCRC
jgi:hypothetical protein